MQLTPTKPRIQIAPNSFEKYCQAVLSPYASSGFGLNEDEESFSSSFSLPKMHIFKEIPAPENKFPVSIIMQKKPLRELPASGQENLGCNCKKSFCRKLYCECFKANRACNIYCRCIMCKNKASAVKKTAEIGSALYCKCSKTKCDKGYCLCYSQNRKCTRMCHCENCSNKVREVRKRLNFKPFAINNKGLCKKSKGVKITTEIVKVIPEGGNKAIKIKIAELNSFHPLPGGS